MDVVRNQVLGSLSPDDRAPNLLVGTGVEIDPTVQLGANVIIDDGVVIGPAAVIMHNVILGQDPVLSPTTRALPVDERITRIAAGATISSGAHVLRGATIGARTIIGDSAFVREGAVIGEDCVIGRNCGVGTSAVVGDRVSVQPHSNLTPWMIVEDDVVVGGHFCATTDDSFGRDPSKARTAVYLRRACRIGLGTRIMSGVEIGEEAVVGAASLVRESVPARTKVAGTPARVIGTVADTDLI
jgi:UDP-2-acetamido-3-amino-2,3-dideoxy-glucuronate N-acetyltransferase